MKNIRKEEVVNNNQTPTLVNKRRVMNSANFVLMPHHLSKGGGVNMTFPNQALTIKDILKKYARGVVPDIMRSELYEDTADFDDIDILRVPGTDIVDIVEKFETINDSYKSERLKKEKGFGKEKSESDITASIKDESSESEAKAE